MALFLLVTRFSDNVALVGFDVKITLISNEATTQTVTTASDGKATFANTANGDYRIEITPDVPNYAFVSLEGEISNNIFLLSDIKLTALPVIQTFAIKTAQSVAIPGATVIFTQSENSIQKITNSSGEVVIDFNDTPFDQSQAVMVTITVTTFPKTTYSYLLDITIPTIHIYLGNATIFPPIPE